MVLWGFFQVIVIRGKIELLRSFCVRTHVEQQSDGLDRVWAVHTRPEFDQRSY